VNRGNLFADAIEGCRSTFWIGGAHHDAGRTRGDEIVHQPDLNRCGGLFRIFEDKVVVGSSPCAFFTPASAAFQKSEAPLTTNASIFLSRRFSLGWFQSASFAADKKMLAFVVNGASDFWKAAEAGVKKAQGELPNYNLVFKYPEQASAAISNQADGRSRRRGCGRQSW